MTSMACPRCGKIVDVSQRAPGDDYACPFCFRAMVVPGAKPKAQPAPGMMSVRCPNCTTEFEVQPERARPGSLLRCVECGAKVRMEAGPGIAGSGSDSGVAFPNLAPEGTLFDMGETGRKPPPEKK